MRNTVIALVCLTGLATAADLSRQKRQSQRSNFQSCSVSPSGIDDPNTPARENAQVSITCNTDTAFDVCVIQHLEPLNVGHSSGSSNNNNNNDDYITKCIGDVQKTGQSCLADSRISYQMSTSQCGFRISRSEPEDTGRWVMSVSEFGESGSGPENIKTMTIYTFNRTIIDFTDDRESDITNRDLEVWYNRDEDEEEWRSGTSGYENVRINCNARGGRPEPTIKWYINNDDRNAFGEEESNSDADRIFDTRENYGATYDDEGYIKDKMSTLSFDVSSDMLNYLSEHYQIDTNPGSEQFSFELTCEVDQGDYGNERLTTSVTVRRIENQDGLKGSTIGWIVGGVLVGALLILIILIAVWAKAAGKFCFDDEKYRGEYRHPQDPKRRPRNQ